MKNIFCNLLLIEKVKGNTIGEIKIFICILKFSFVNWKKCMYVVNYYSGYMVYMCIIIEVFRGF